jgi:hypothetical protein
MITNYYVPNQAITVHRDQDQKVPLYGALEKGCKYIEFDLHLAENGELLVGHDKGERDKTIESVYLNPLYNLNQAGFLGGEFNLIVDIKTKAKETFSALQKVLKKYSSMLTTYHEDTGLIQRKVKVIISGNRDKAAIAKARPRLAFYDGRIDDLSGSLDPSFMPLISEKWEKVLHPQLGYWSLMGMGYYVIDLDNSIREIIKDKVNTAARAGIAFRPWAMPEKEHTWRLLADLREQGFVYNTDYPDRLVKFFRTSLEQESVLKQKRPSLSRSCVLL